MNNLIKNGTFVADWGVEKSHNCAVISPDKKTIIVKEIGNIFTPPGWLTWFLHDANKWDQPEVRDAWATVDPRRVLDGDKAILMFSFFRKHDGGFMQTVSVTPGTRLRVGGHAHAWSNSKDGPHKDDGLWSEGPGYDAGYRLEGEDTNTDWQNFTFYVGVDPTGGTNPYADTVLWGRGAHVYNKYAALPGVEFDATGDTVTVFLRSRVMWPFKHNDAYWDSITLTEVDTEPDPTPYESTMLILPQDGTPTQLQEIFEAGYPDRRTFGFSYDDGGHLNGTVVLYNIPDDKQAAFNTYYAQRYPDVVVQFAYTSDWEDEPEEPAGPWEKYLLGQRDAPWRDSPFGSSICDKTIGESGCYITNVAMGQRVYEIRNDATPVTVDAALGKAGYTGCLARWDAIKAGCGIQITSSGDLDAHLAAGKVAMGEVRFPTTGGQHFLLLVEKRGDDYLALDPWHREVALVSGRYAKLVSYRLLSEAGGDPPPTEPKKTCAFVGLHQQVIVVGAQEFHTDLKPGISKVFTLEDVEGMLRWSPDTPVVFRHYNNNSGPFLQNPDKEAGARAWIDQFGDSMGRVCDRIARDFPGKEAPYFIVESTNEDYPSNNAGVISNVAAFDEAFIRVLAATGLPVAAGVFNAAVGNPLPTEYVLLEKMARTAMEYGAYFGYHNYWPGCPTKGGPDSLWEYLAGRFTELDDHLTARGIYVKHYGGESGVVGGEWDDDRSTLDRLVAHKDEYPLYNRARFREFDRYGVVCGAPVGLNSSFDVRGAPRAIRGVVYLKPYDGWMSNACYDHDWARYLEDILVMNEKLRVWNLSHQNRYLGIVLFTTGASYTGWDSFQIQHREMGDIKRALACA